MYAYIKGTITEKRDNTAVIETGGIGYETVVSAYTANSLAEGKETTLYTYLAVKEDGAALFGFSTREEKELFVMLISVGGIGPKGATVILGGMTPKELRACIASGNTQALYSIKGVGKKTAERIIMELRDKMTDGGAEAPVQAAKELTGVAAEATEVLVALGYKRDAAIKAVDAAYKEGMNVNQTVHKAIGGK